MYFEQIENKAIASDQPCTDTEPPIISDKQFFPYHGKLLATLPKHPPRISTIVQQRGFDETISSITGSN